MDVSVNDWARFILSLITMVVSFITGHSLGKSSCPPNDEEK